MKIVSLESPKHLKNNLALFSPNSFFLAKFCHLSLILGFILTSLTALPTYAEVKKQACLAERKSDKDYPPVLELGKKSRLGYQSLRREECEPCSGDSFYIFYDDSSKECLSNGPPPSAEFDYCICQKMVEGLELYCTGPTAGCSMDHIFCKKLVSYLRKCTW